MTPIIMTTELKIFPKKHHHSASSILQSGDTSLSALTIETWNDVVIQHFTLCHDRVESKNARTRLCVDNPSKLVSLCDKRSPSLAFTHNPT